MKVDTNTRIWIKDRVDNMEPLMWGSFIEFMGEIGYKGKKIKHYKSKSYKKFVQHMYSQHKAAERKRLKSW